MKYCQPCVTIVCGIAGQSRPPMPGRCPSCRGFIAIDAGGVVTALERWEGVCAVCGQQRQLMSVGDRPVCEGCAYGMQNRLRYQCDRCRKASGRCVRACVVLGAVIVACVCLCLCVCTCVGGGNLVNFE